MFSSGTRKKTSWLGWGREGLSWSFKFMILDFDLFQKSSAKFFRPRVLLNFQLKVNIFFLKWEYGVFESIYYIVTSLRLWSISTIKVQIQIMQTFFHLEKLPYPWSAFKSSFKRWCLHDHTQFRKILCMGEKVQKIGIVEFGGGNRFWLSNHDERSMQSLKRFVHPPLTSEQEMIIK